MDPWEKTRPFTSNILLKFDVFVVIIVLMLLCTILRLAKTL